GAGDAGNHVEQRALAGTVGADHGLDLTHAHAEAQIGNGHHPVETTGEIVDLQQVRAHACLFAAKRRARPRMSAAGTLARPPGNAISTMSIPRPNSISSASS